MMIIPKILLILLLSGFFLFSFCFSFGQLRAAISGYYVVRYEEPLEMTIEDRIYSLAAGMLFFAVSGFLVIVIIAIICR